MEEKGGHVHMGLQGILGLFRKWFQFRNPTVILLLFLTPIVAPNQQWIVLFILFIVYKIILLSIKKQFLSNYFICIKINEINLNNIIFLCNYEMIIIS